MTKKRANRGSKMIFRRARRGGGHYPGYYIRWTDADGRRHQEFGGRTHNNAQTTLRKRLDEKDRHRSLGERPVEMQSLSDFLPSLLEHLNATKRPATVMSRTGILTRAAEHFGRKPMARITQTDVQEWMDSLATTDGVKASTMRFRAAVLASAFTVAIAFGRARVNPARGIRLPKADEKPIPVLSPDQIRRLSASMPPQIRPCVVLMGETGIRRQEALDLTWGAFDEGFRQVTVRRSKNHRPRTIPLTEEAQRVAKQLWKRRGATPLEGPHFLFDFGTAKLNHLFRAAADKAGFKDVTPHTLRHAVGVAMASAAVPTVSIRDFLGHSSIKMTERYMGRAPQSALETAVRRMEESRRVTKKKPAANA